MSVHVEEVRPDILRLEFPGQGSPSGRVNCWALRDGVGWVLIDTGDDTEQTRALWCDAIDRDLKAPVTRIICTHYHRDHIGQAAWLSERFSAPVTMSEGEWKRAQAVFEGAYAAADGPLARQLIAGGMKTQDIERILSNRGHSRFTLPHRYNRVDAGDILHIGTMRWRVELAGGHSPAALILTEPEQDLIVVGDQVLETITPHIGVPPMAPLSDPLGAYLSFLTGMHANSGRALGLPGHGRTLADLPGRTRQLIDYHDACLERLLSALETPQKCVDAVPILFGRELEGFALVLGMTETHAHLNRLLVTNKVRKCVSADVEYFVAL